MPWRPRHPVGWRCRVSRGARKTMLGTASAAWDAGPAPDRTPARPATQSSRHHTDASPMTNGTPPPDRKGDRHIAGETGPLTEPWIASRQSLARQHNTQQAAMDDIRSTARTAANPQLT